jgi:hypothetical protein
VASGHRKSPFSSSDMRMHDILSHTDLWSDCFPNMLCFWLSTKPSKQQQDTSYEMSFFCKITTHPLIILSNIRWNAISSIMHSYVTPFHFCSWAEGLGFGWGCRGWLYREGGWAAEAQQWLHCRYYLPASPPLVYSEDYALVSGIDGHDFFLCIQRHMKKKL